MIIQTIRINIEKVIRYTCPSPPFFSYIPLFVSCVPHAYLRRRHQGQEHKTIPATVGGFGWFQAPKQNAKKKCCNIKESMLDRIHLPHAFSRSPVCATSHASAGYCLPATASNWRTAVDARCVERGEGRGTGTASARLGLHMKQDQGCYQANFNLARCTAFVPLGLGCTDTIPWPAGSVGYASTGVETKDKGTGVRIKSPIPRKK